MLKKVRSLSPTLARTGPLFLLLCEKRGVHFLCATRQIQQQNKEKNRTRIKQMGNTRKKKFKIIKAEQLAVAKLLAITAIAAKRQATTVNVWTVNGKRQTARTARPKEFAHMNT